MARKSSNSSDSLDMLLDTMCNAFGGIVIIAILVALLMRETGKKPVPGNAKDEAIARHELPLTEDQIKVEQARLERLKREVEANGVVAALIKQLNELLEQKQKLQAAKTALELQGTKAAADARGMIGKQEDTIAKLGKMKGEMIAQTAAISAEILKLQALIEDLKNELKKWGGDANSRLTKRPPREQQSTKAAFNLVFRHGEIFPVQEYTGSQIPKSSKYIDWQGNEARLKQGAGLKVDANKNDILEILEKLPANQLDVVSYVYRDSFESYLAFQKILALTKNSLEGGWEPVGSDGNLAFDTSGTRPATQ